MPLENCRITDETCIGRNIAKLRKEGKDRQQAVAIAYSSARSFSKKRKTKRKYK